MNKRWLRPGETLVVDETTLDEKKIQVYSVDIPIEEIRLDPFNPRIGNSIKSEDLASEAQIQREIEEILWRDTDLKELERAITLNGGIHERIIVRADGTVAEGNRRAVVYRTLNRRAPDDGTWQRIPARVLPDDISDKGIAILLGEMHVVGKNSWPPYEKAAHIYNLHREFGLTQEEISVRLRMSKSKVNQLIRAFELMRSKYLARFNEPGGIRKFSYFEELFKKPELKDWLISTPGAEDQFVDWVGNGQIDQGVQVRELHLIVANETAKQVLATRGFEAAKKVLSDGDPASSSKLFKKMIDLTYALQDATLGDIRQVQHDKTESSLRVLVELKEALDKFVELCGIDERRSR